MTLFELRACWAEYYDCPDNGQTRICDTYETVGFAIADDTRLRVLAKDLATGFEDCWSEERSLHLRRIYPGFDAHEGIEYSIVNVSDRIVNPPDGKPDVKKRGSLQT
jgi:hypothetical protein